MAIVYGLVAVGHRYLICVCIEIVSALLYNMTLSFSLLVCAAHSSRSCMSESSILLSFSNSTEIHSPVAVSAECPIAPSSLIPTPNI